MILDLILFRPEFFLLFSFFLLLWYGTGNLRSPVSEILTVPKRFVLKNTFPQRKERNIFSFRKTPTRGPFHAVSA
jgi:NADH-quinone oxidoreductase subunit N